jgi:hypothetical protein
MTVSRAVVALTALAASAVSALAAPAPHAFRMMPAAAPRHGGEFHMFQHEAWRRGDRFPGLAVGGVYPDYSASGAQPEMVGSSIFVAPVSVTVSVAPATDAHSYWVDGPRLIEIARPAGPRRPLPLVIYGDPGA